MSIEISVAGIQHHLDDSPFIAFLGLQCVSVSAHPASVELRMPMSAPLERGPGSGQFHGGPIAALIDTAGDFAIIAATGHGVPTVNLRVDYLRPAGGKQLVARATARRIGRTLGVADIDVIDDEERLVALGRGTFAIIDA